MGKGGSSGGSIMGIIRTPLGIIVLFIIMLVLSGLSIASAISGELTADQVWISTPGLNCCFLSWFAGGHCAPGGYLSAGQKVASERSITKKTRCAGSLFGSSSWMPGLSCLSKPMH